ncbi:MAG: SGNH/GDSL hydrolase family protein [Chloroflexota bacterium]
MRHNQSSRVNVTFPRIQVFFPPMTAVPSVHAPRVALLGILMLSVCVLGCSVPAAASAPLTYVAIGASDSVGVGAAEPSAEGWVPRLGLLLGRETRVVNLGVSGSTLAQAILEQLGPALDARPDVVSVWLAVNDLNARVPLPQYEADLDRLLGEMRGDGRCILVGNVPDLTRAPVYARQDPSALRATIQAWNAVIARVALRHGATLVDLDARWQEITDHPEYLSADGFHPSSEGYARLATLFQEDYRRGC